jgi:beta-phosphoglucomutase-like phosphatase (HAD superfamily)
MKLPRKARAVVFDMDGLIFNTEALCRDAVMEAAADAGHDIPLAFYLSTIGMSGEVTRLAFREHCGTAFDFDLFWTAATTRFHATIKSQLCLKPGVVELLDVLDHAGLPRAIATSSRHEDVQRNLAIHGLLDRFPVVIARGDYLRGKPGPGPSCVALEDSRHGVRSASSAGMMTIMVPDLLPPTDEMQELCVGIAPDLHEVCSLMRSQQIP